jgi:hypothetical protein
MAPAAREESPDSHSQAVTDWIDRHRRLWFVLVALMLAISFNGKWHLGPDSAGYRQLGHNLAAHGRYFFRTDIPGVDQYHNEQGTRYPGLPILLAVLERLFGQADLPPLILMMMMAVLSLVLIFRLMLYRLPRWLAVCVVVGVGTNPRFIQYSNEILSDVPFLLGVAVTMLGFEQVMNAPNRKWLSIGILNTFAGLLLAAAMRPTFLILGAALVAACLWGILRGTVQLRLPFARKSVTPAPPSPFAGEIAKSPSPFPKETAQSRLPFAAPPTRAAVRWRSAMLIAALLLATIVFITLIDIRSRQSGFLSGGYEERMVSKVENFSNKVAPLLPGNVGELLEDALPMAVMGYRSGWGLINLAGHHLGFGAGFSLIVICSGIWLARRNMLWGMFVLLTIIALIFAGPVPRYFLMILPLLLAGWGLFIQRIAALFRSRFGARFVMGFGLFFLLTINAVASSEFIMTQRGFSKLLDSHHHWQGLHHVGFLKAYDFGHWVGFDRLAMSIHKATSPHDKIIGPDANVLTFLTDRQVYPPILGNRTKLAGQLFHLAIFPADMNWHRSNGEYEAALKPFLRELHRMEGPIIAGPQAGLSLAQMIAIPPHHLSKSAHLEHDRKMALRRKRAARQATRPSTP